MSETILDKIFETKRRRVKSVLTQAAKIVTQARTVREHSTPHRFRGALADRSRINIIAEFKKASPSKGVISEVGDPADVAQKYEAGGAVAISVLTEEDFFNGSLDDLRVVRGAVSLPILRKDFIFDAHQIYEAAAAGADAILLIAAMLDDRQLTHLRSLTEDELGIDALVEVHTREELERVRKAGAKLIGVNNRDLKSFNVSLDISRELIKHAPENAIMIAESGLRTREDIEELREIGYSGFLIGETLMRSDEPIKILKEFIN